MTNEERDIITRFIERIGGAQGATGFTQGGQAAQPLPPIDPDADRLIGELLARHPEARYRLTQTAFVQEQALAQATAAIQRLQQELTQAHQAAAAPQSTGGGGFFSGLFGGSRQSAPPPQQAVWNQGGAPQPQYGSPQYGSPPPQYAQGYQPGMLGSGRSGFLGSALTTAAGVAGGVVLGNALMNMFEGHQGSAANLLPNVGESPWGTPPPAGGAGGEGGGYVDQGSWTPDAGGGAGGGWTDASAQPDQGGGWSDAQPASDSWSDSGGGSDAGGGDGGGWSDDSGGGGWDDSSNA